MLSRTEAIMERRLAEFLELEALAARQGTIPPGRLQFTFEAFLDGYWADRSNPDLVDADLAGLSALHHYLIGQVAMRLAAEESAEAAAAFQTGRAVPSLLADLPHGAGALGMRCLKSTRYFIVGDLHADDDALQLVLQVSDFWERQAKSEDFVIVCLGDYVDCGHQHLKTLERLLALKTLFPTRFCLLRGNHDGGRILADGSVQPPYRIPATDDPLDYFPPYMQALAAGNPSLDPGLLAAWLNLFDCLPYIAWLEAGGQAWQCVHGGLPRPGRGQSLADGGQLKTHWDHLDSLADITMHGQPDNAGASIRENLIWSDPCRDDDDLRLQSRRFGFSAAHFDSWCAAFGLAGIFRGHEVAENGVEEHFGGRLLTVFSSGSTADSHYSWVKPAIVELSGDGQRRILPLRPEAAKVL
ncbi:MAG: hypothetical protein A2087_13075 [Spirochaetes bacterium GWD1_61_31]|nr:MAG: hypothetical protein A2Y37_02480 [Spirochaetes bacterium GWB1_60_80]OHD28575.1 MAG: hypothetical protein A2004_03055 [Spirochaetes bacterium GWC1_61_12]OHD39430.1 MAG: hypothetical protein A2087_13075 [Spirochaetes bacterium GWD1_61_31]OHD45484.1 MAG: hypothetical protein A2Y35_02750 [Spirochaetes bacterium GWE1_60_18]HAP44622.1 hypothetical protein [Spirochaetaceae bacterium]